jgi:hypothetical protein
LVRRSFRRFSAKLWIEASSAARVSWDLTPRTIIGLQKGTYFQLVKNNLYLHLPDEPLVGVLEGVRDQLFPEW